MHRRDRNWTSESGFTLAELLVSTVVTLMVLAAALGSFSDAVRITDAARETTDTNQSLEVATTLMVRDFIQAGHGIPLGGVPIPSGAGAEPVRRPSPPGSNMTFPVGTLTLPAVTPGGALGPLVLGVQTDMVHVMYDDPTLPLSSLPLSNIAADGSSMTVNNAININAQDRIRAGDVILFWNANGTAIQMVTSVNGQTVFFAANDPMLLNQRGATQGTIMNLKNGNQWPQTTARRVNLVSYYIDAVTDPALPRLVRQVNMNARLAIALGIENYQVTYDLVDGGANPTNVETPVLPSSPNHIRKANLFLAARALAVNPRTRQFFRNTVATQVSLRSLAFVDRYQ
jgi:type II secretory pathway pseudopilin PulG